MTISNCEVAKRFVAKETNGTSAHMFINGDTIYSYGEHFPIARWVGDVAYFNTMSYSPSTSRHQNCVLGKLMSINAKIIYLPDCESGNVKAAIRHNDDRIAKLIRLANRARTEGKKARYEAEIIELKQRNADLAPIFGKILAEEI